MFIYRKGTSKYIINQQINRHIRVLYRGEYHEILHIGNKDVSWFWTKKRYNQIDPYNIGKELFYTKRHLFSTTIP